MKILKPILLSLLTLSLFSATSGAQSRMNRVAWSERSLALPSTEAPNAIDSSIERFWNTPKGHSTPNITAREATPNNTQSRSSPQNNTLEQSRNTRERRGFFGINLFNVIPIIDIVHGNVVTENNDRVTSKK